MMRAVLAALFILTAAAASAQHHPSTLPALTPDAVFPRCADSQLAVAGFPDHKHAQHWHDWTVLQDADGVPYGPGSLCQGKVVREHPDLEILPGEKRHGRFVMLHNPGYKDCDMLPFVELMAWAEREVTAVLGLEATGTLTILNPDNTQHYKEQSGGQGVWRLYRLQDDEVVLQPYPVLLARTLDGHAAFMLMTDWLLQSALDAELPAWLRQGLVEYVGEHGTHLHNYMGEFRAKGPVMMSAPLVDAILSRGLDPDEGADRENYRRACYSAFLMVWQLVEYEGGLEALQMFLREVADGAAVDEAARLAWGMDLATLASLVDAPTNGEPAGGKMRRQTPHVQP